MIRFMGNDFYELEIEGKLFSESWEKFKSRNSFAWETKDKKHDPYDVRQFGDQLQTNSTKDTSGTFGSGLREEELAHDREQFDFVKYEKQNSKVAKEEKLESGFDSVFE